METKVKKNYNLIVSLIALVIILMVVSLIGYFISKPKPLVIQGQAEASEYRVSGKVPGRIEVLFAKPGQQVHRGDTLATIDSPEVHAKLAQANAVREAASAQNDKAKHGARREQIAGAKGLYDAACVQVEVLKKSYERIERLYEQKVVSAQNRDEVKAKYDAAIAQMNAAKSQYDMALSGARIEDKEAAAAMVRQVDGVLMEVNAYLSELYLTSPVDGYISAVFPKVGELVGTGSPVMTVMNLNDIWFSFNVREDYLQDMGIGRRLTLRIPALGNKEISATINYMAVRESYATWKATKETDQYDAKTFEVRAVPDSQVEGLLPGMTALVVR